MRNFIFKHLVSLFFVMPLLLMAGAHAHASIYSAELPPQLSSSADLCAYAPCGNVIKANRFSNRMGNPSYVEAYRLQDGKKKLVGYVFLSTDIVNIPAYSGKPIVTLIGMDTQGMITGLQVLKHSEPILLVGIPESKLVDFVRQYIGKFVGDRFEIGKASEDGEAVGLDGISSATVTAITENQVISRSAYEIAQEVGIVKAVRRPQAKLAPISEHLDWKSLVHEGSIERLTIQPTEVGARDSGQPYIDQYFGYLNAPSIGRSILGDTDYQHLMEELKPGEHAIFIVGNGTSSFKGTAFVRGGIFDRIQIRQGMDTFTFRDTDYRNLYGIRAPGAPSYTQSGIFIIRSPAFSAAYPWKLMFLAHKLDTRTDTKTFSNFERQYWLPARYLEGGRPRLITPQPVWMRVWLAKRLQIAAFILLLVAASTVYALRDKLVRRANHKDKRWVSLPKTLIWITSAGFVGFFAMAQPSVTQVLTWFHSLIYHWRWELFLSDPLIFLFWWFIILSVFIWGRGLFCGWLCPYGSLSELAYKLAGRIGLGRFQFKLDKPWHDRLKWVKYIVFATLLATSFYSMGLAEKLAEVEPFKTTFLVGVWNRSWPFVLYWATLMGLSLFMERPFCKYLCPLGAGLAIPSTFRMFGLKRKAECQSCHACANGCGSLAIDDQGKIDQRECLLCLDCMVMYYDDTACPPLTRERKTRQKLGQPLTPISKDGYFLPVKEIKD